MKELIQSMVVWHRNRCLDPEVWESFLRHHLDPALMPAPSDVQLQTDQQDGQLPTGDTVDNIKLLFIFLFEIVVSVADPRFPQTVGCRGNKSVFLAELFRGMLFKWKGKDKKSHQK